MGIIGELFFSYAHSNKQMNRWALLQLELVNPMNFKKFSSFQLNGNYSLRNVYSSAPTMYQHKSFYWLQQIDMVE